MLTKGETQAIAEAVHERMMAGADTYHIDAKAHYDTHARLDRLLGVFDTCESMAWKFVLGTVIVVGFVVAVIWQIVSGGKT